MFYRRAPLIYRGLHGHLLLFFRYLDSLRLTVICATRAWNMGVVQVAGLLCTLLPRERSVFPIICVIMLPLSNHFPLAIDVTRRQFAVQDTRVGYMLVNRFLVPFNGGRESKTLVRNQPRYVNPRAGRRFGGAYVHFQPCLSFPLKELVVFPAPKDRSPIFVVGGCSPVDCLEVVRFPRAYERAGFLFFFKCHVDPPFP